VKVIIQPSAITGTIMAAASKSAMQRACALALLHEGETTIINPGKSNDDMAALQIIRELGAVVNMNNSGPKAGEPDKISIDSPTQKNRTIKKGGSIPRVNCGESGLSFRMFAPIAALSADEIILAGEGSLLNRPMDFFDKIFPQLGVAIESDHGKLPLKIKGPLVPRDITIDGSLSSQFLTGLLMAFAKAATGAVTITVTNLTSKPYIDLTLQMMKHFGFEVENINYERFCIQPQTINRKPQAYTVESDWSGAAFLLVAGAIAGEIMVKGLDVFSTQADKAILQALMMAGAVISIEEKQVSVAPPLGNRGKAFHFNANDCPDLFPPLVALAAYCEGTSVIEGAGRLQHKESNRAITLQKEFAKMGVSITLQDDLMLIEGGAGPKGAMLHAHHDHRIAMACAVAALQAAGETQIDNAEAINKSYPEFYRHLKMLGANVSLQ
jgi:3-phosphoshikimate 1-carboxyvinyltransferase